MKAMKIFQLVMMLLICVVLIVTTVKVSNISVGVENNAAPNANNQAVTPQVNDTPVNNGSTPAVTDPAAPAGSPENQDLVTMLTNAINNTKAYQQDLTVNHIAAFDVKVTECTGGSVVASIADRIVGLIIKPVEETLVFKNGKAVNSEGLEVDPLLPENRMFSLPQEGIESITSSKNGENTIIEVKLIPETIGLNEAPAVNNAAIGYLDISEFDLSFIQITDASFDYLNSTITAEILPNGLIKSIEYFIPVKVIGSASAGFLTGSATFEGNQKDIWEIQW